jgi:transcriptional regulator with XRE-family HTH domain
VDFSIGKRLKEERERLGYDQDRFSALSGASRYSQIDWEKGKSFPNAKFLSAIAAAGADVNYILTGIRLETIKESHPGYHLRPDQIALLDNLDHCSPEDQAAIKRLALLAAAAADVTETQSQEEQAPPHQQTG